MAHEPNFVGTPEDFADGLKSEDEQERIDSAWALSELGRKGLPALPALIQALKEHPEDARLIACVCDALKSMAPESKAAEAELKALLNSKDKAIRVEAEEVLLLFNDPEAYKRRIRQRQRKGLEGCGLILLPVVAVVGYCLYKVIMWLVYG